MESRVNTHSMPGHLIRRMQQLSNNHFATRMREAGLDLTSVQFAALDAISANEGLDQATLADLIAYDRATIGGVVNRLLDKGLIARTVSRRDRRSKELRLTEDGERTLVQLAGPVDAVQAAILANLTPDEQAQFLALSRKLLGASLPQVEAC